jgi:hypothetical protein
LSFVKTFQRHQSQSIRYQRSETRDQSNRPAASRRARAHARDSFGNKHPTLNAERPTPNEFASRRPIEEDSRLRPAAAGLRRAKEAGGQTSNIEHQRTITVRMWSVEFSTASKAELICPASRSTKRSVPCGNRSFPFRANSMSKGSSAAR